MTTKCIDYWPEDPECKYNSSKKQFALLLTDGNTTLEEIDLSNVHICEKTYVSWSLSLKPPFLKKVVKRYVKLREYRKYSSIKSSSDEDLVLDVDCTLEEIAELFNLKYESLAEVKMNKAIRGD